MLAIHGAAQDIELIRILLVVAAILTVVFWRLFLQMMIIIATALILVGAVSLLQGILHVIK